LAAIGLVPNLILGETNALYTRVAKGTFNAFFGPGDTSLLGVYDTEALLRWDYYGVAARELYYWTTPNAVKVSTLLDEAISAPTVAGRNKLLAEVQNLVQDESPAPTILFLRQLTAWSDKLHGFQPSPTQGLDFIGVTGSA
jgi:ABC-type transport system substrate-binding protein